MARLGKQRTVHSDLFECNAEQLNHDRSTTLHFQGLDGMAFVKSELERMEHFRFLHPTSKWQMWWCKSESGQATIIAYDSKKIHIQGTDARGLTRALIQSLRRRNEIQGTKV